MADRLFPPDLSRYRITSPAIRAEGGALMQVRLVEDGRLRLYTTPDAVDPLYLRMLISYEDKRFDRHGGVDGLAVLRAVFQALKHGEVVSGASTLSMQAARLLEPRPRTLSAKLIEMFRAWQLERRHSKSEILSIYLTLAPFGGNLEGVRAGSLFWFGREPGRLTPDQAALLVALPQSPGRLRPDRHPDAARAARNKVLRRVADRIDLAPDLLELAVKAPVPSYGVAWPSLAPHLADRLTRGDRTERFRPGSDVMTSVSLRLQHRVEALARAAAAATHAQASVAVLVAELTTRKVRAYVGSPGLDNRRRHGFVDMVRAVRSPGSTLKPIIYGLAFDAGLARPETRIRDAPRRFGDYEPHNFMDRHYGMVTMREALQRSLNVPAVAVLERLGSVRFSEHLRAAGIAIALPGAEPPGLAVALGGAGLTLEQLTALYAALGDDGMVRPFCYLAAGTECRTPSGRLLMRTKARQQIAAILTGLKPPGHLLSWRFQTTPRQVSFKTGTSYGFRDAWAVGFDAEHVVGVWLGRADGTPVPGRYGANTAAPLLFQVFGLLPLNPPRPLESRVVDARTGVQLPPRLRYFDAPDRFLVSSAQAPAPTISYPPPASTVEAPAGSATNVVVEGGTRPLYLFVNNRLAGASNWSQALSWQVPEPGFFRIVVVDAEGRRATTQVRVVSD